MANNESPGLEVTKKVQVNVPIERAFAFFVEHMELWWPASHHIGKSPFVAISIEPRVGGRWFETNTAGEQCTWGTVLVWDPPHRLCLSWHLGPGHERPEWVFDPDMGKASEVELRFRAAGAGITVVDLVHSRLERHGEGAEALRELFDGPTAWQGILDRYAQHVQSAGLAGAQS